MTYNQKTMEEKHVELVAKMNAALKRQDGDLTLVRGIDRGIKKSARV